MKKILLLTTGGTIAARQSGEGFAPSLRSEDMVRYLDSCVEGYTFDNENLMDLDSSNIQPEEWRVMAQRIFHALKQYDGIILTHGTDTMAYTASALSFMLQNLKKSVVLTGSQLPMENPLTDAKTNLYTAIEAIRCGVLGVTVAFNRKMIAGSRAVKTSTLGFDAFDSVNSSYVGEIYADKTRIFEHHPCPPVGDGLPCLKDEICEDVFLLKLLPGTNPDFFDALLGMGYKGLVIEAFGAGGLHYVHRNLLEKLEMLQKAGVVVVVCSQCLYERCEMSIYEVGQKILAKGVVPGRDMTTEAAATKLMWCLGQTKDPAEVRRMFDVNFAGEVVL